VTNYSDLLKQNNLKSTFQRVNILEVIDKNGHMSVDGIYNEVASVHPSLSLATIYKNIIMMLDKNILVEVPILGQKSKYEIIKKNHIHLVCENCAEVYDKPYALEADKILSELANQAHFTLSKQQINLYGVCESCQHNELSVRIEA